MKKMILSVLGLCLTVVLLAACSTSSTPSEDTYTAAELEAIEDNKAQRSRVENLVAEIEEHLVVSSDGLLELGVSADGTTPELSEEALAFFEQAKTGLNEAVSAGDVTLNADLTVTPTEDPDVISAEWATVLWRWWGVYLVMDNNGVRNARYALDVGAIAAGAGMSISGVGWVPGVITIALARVGSRTLQWCNSSGRGTTLYYSYRYRSGYCWGR